MLTANVTADFNPHITTIHLVNIAAADSIDNAVNIGNITYAYRDLSENSAKRMTATKSRLTKTTWCISALTTDPVPLQTPICARP